MKQISEKLMKRGEKIFNSKENFLYWLTTNIIALGGKSPVQCSEKEVMEELDKIENGVYS